MTKVGLGHGMVGSVQNYTSPFNIFAMAEVAMYVPNKRYSILKNANINVKKSLYTSVIDLVVEHIVTTPKCSETKFTVPIFAVFDV